MPLVRFAVKNEYGLGVEELYKDGVESEDPKAVLDGVAVAGLVGVLRQLGDLAQFAAEVFHGLQEQVASTSSRSRKLVSRVQRIEASLPSLEKAILSQTDHLRFAYTPGSERHAYIRTERNLFICDDLPHFIMDSYEECREPPRLQLLDRFDSGSPGSCLKRYSDPSFFKRASSCSEVSNSEKCQRERKSRKIKKRRSWQRSGQFPKTAPNLNGSSRMQFSSAGHGQSSLSQTGSTFDMTLKSGLGDQSDSRGSKDCMDFIECLSRPSISTQPDETKIKGFGSSATEVEVTTNGSIYIEEQTSIASDDKQCSHAVVETVPRSSSASWDELLEMVEPTDVSYEIEDTHQLPETNAFLHELEFESVEKGVKQVNDLSEEGSEPKLKADAWHLSTTSDENFMEPTGLNCRSNEVQDYLKKKFDFREHHLDPPYLKPCISVVKFSEGGKPPEPTVNGTLINDPMYRGLETGEAQLLLETNLVAEKQLKTVDSEHVSAVDPFSEVCSNVRAIEWNLQESETGYEEHASQVDAFCEGENNVKVIEWHERDLETVGSEHVSQEDAFFEGGNNAKVIEWNQQGLETITAQHVNEMDTFSEGENPVKLIKWNQQELEMQSAENVSQASTFTEGGNSVQVIEWNQFDDIDSGTENFVDALNTIDSESESEFETEMKIEDPTAGFRYELGESLVNGQTSDITSHTEPEHQLFVRSYGCKEGGSEDLERSTSMFCEEQSVQTSYTEPKHQRFVTSYGYKEGGSEDLEQSTSMFCADQFVQNSQSANTCSADRTLLSHDKTESAAGHKLEASPCLSEEESVHTSQSSALSNVTQGPDSCANDPVIIVEPAACEIANSAAADHKMDISTCLSEEQSMQTSQSATLSNAPQCPDISTNNPAISVEPAVSKIANSGTEAPGDEMIVGAPHMSLKVSVGSSSTSDPLALWTNGTLFGLAPSKPVVFTMPDSVDSVPTSNCGKVDQYSLDAAQKVDPAGILSSSADRSEQGKQLDNYGQDVDSSKHFSHQRLEKVHDTSVGHTKINSSDHPAILDPSDGSAMRIESKVPMENDVKDVSSEVTGAGEDRSSLLSVLSRGLLKNGLRRSGSLGYNETRESSSPSKLNEFDNRCQNTVLHPAPKTNLKGKLNSPVNSPPPSPPLEHMRISFQPVDGFDKSRLKLQYPEGVDHCENTLDSFPTFQLVPESTKLQHDIGSDSDDDTFCRSYACMSDESNSHLSDSNSEQWESGDSTESNDHTLYDGLHRISSAESASVSPHLEEADHGNIHGSGSVSDAHSLSNPSLGLPVLDAQNPFGCQELKLCLSPGLDSSHHLEPRHEPPPLPPMQWRVSSLLFNEVEDNQSLGSDSLHQSFVPKFLNSAITHPAKVDSAKLISTTQESATIAKPKKVEDQKFGQEQTYHAEKEKGMDDKGDFLHQIRSKSFNLKRAEPTRATYTPTPATSNKITAIIQKANAIRKAVGSDDGEDDSWSDT